MASTPVGSEASKANVGGGQELTKAVGREMTVKEVQAMGKLVVNGQSAEKMPHVGSHTVRDVCHKCRMLARTRYAMSGMCEMWLDAGAWHGSKVPGRDAPKKLSITNTEVSILHQYGEISVKGFAEVLSAVAPSEDDVFVDLGSGTGKAVMLAAALYPVKMSVS